MSLSAVVIKTDHDLESAAERSTDQLARHRWHWTLDQSNPDRIDVADYAKAVGKPYSAIRQMVLGFDSHFHSDDASSDLGTHIGRARMSGETAAAAEAVAKSRGKSMRSVQDSRSPYHNEVRRVREIARQRAEERGTSVEEEAPRVAEVLVRHEQAQQATEAERREHADLRFVEMEGYLVKAKRELLRALKLAPVVPWDDESKELLTDTVGNVKALLALIDTALSGISGVDWDAEWMKVAGDERL